MVLRIWYSTLKIKIDPESLENARPQHGPCVLFFWHNRLFVAPYLRSFFRPKRHMYGLVSASHDGAWLCGLLECFGVYAVRGSSSWRGKEAIKELYGCINDPEADIVITPDGPRGPRYEFKKGSLLFAQKSRLPILFVSFNFLNSWRVNSWDRFFLPKPFSTVNIRAVRENIVDWPEEEVLIRAQQTLLQLAENNL